MPNLTSSSTNPPKTGWLLRGLGRGRDLVWSENANRPPHTSDLEDVSWTSVH